MEQLLKVLAVFDRWLWGNWLLFVLLGVGLLYTMITGGVQIRYFRYICLFYTSPSPRDA